MGERLVHYTYEEFNAYNTRELVFSTLQDQIEEATKDGSSWYHGFTGRELERVIDLSEEGKKTVIDMILMCNSGGHSGFSIHWVVPMFKRILNKNGWVEYDENAEEDDDYGDMIQMNVIGIYCIYDIRCAEHMFSKEERENILKYFSLLVMHEPATPLTFDDDEWNDISRENDGKPLYQNKRCSAVFKDGSEAIPHYLDSFIWEYEYDADWSSTGKDRSAHTGWTNFNNDTQEVSSSGYIDVEKYKASGDIKLKRHYTLVTPYPQDEKERETFEHHMLDEAAFFEMVKDTYYIPIIKDIKAPMITPDKEVAEITLKPMTAKISEDTHYELC